MTSTSSWPGSFFSSSFQMFATTGMAMAASSTPGRIVQPTSRRVLPWVWGGRSSGSSSSPLTRFFTASTIVPPMTATKMTPMMYQMGFIRS